MSQFGMTLQHRTEQFINWRRERAERQKKRAQAKHPVRDWLEAFLWAACVVLLINQYIFQAYRIPSGSMIPTLLIGDNIFVNKFVYGPELLPGIGKLPGLCVPERNNIIIFENPDYVSRGAVYTLVKRLTYMLTLSLVDIERIQTGSLVQDLFIKRAIGIGGDRVRYADGQTLVLPVGAERWLNIDAFQLDFGIDFTTQRLSSTEDLPFLREALRIRVWQEEGLITRGRAQERLAVLNERLRSERDQNGVLVRTYDRLQSTNEIVRTSLSMDPGNRGLWEEASRARNGWFVPESRILPLGDNRDDSQDGRFFGPILKENILGEAALRFWPLGRIGTIE